MVTVGEGERTGAGILALFDADGEHDVGALVTWLEQQPIIPYQNIEALILVEALVPGDEEGRVLAAHLDQRRDFSSQFIVEVGQVRMGTNPWDNKELFEQQSAIYNVRNIKTPFLILHGTADNAVDWHQGLELYGAARRWGKPLAVMMPSH